MAQPMQGGRRQRTLLTAETKWQILVDIMSGQITQSDAARKYNVDVSVIVKLRRDAKDAAMVAFAAKPGKAKTPRDVELEDLKAENARLTEVVKVLAIEVGLLRGKGTWA
jgi:transposase-like protein